MLNQQGLWLLYLLGLWLLYWDCFGHLLLFGVNALVDPNAYLLSSINLLADGLIKDPIVQSHAMIS